MEFAGLEEGGKSLVVSGANLQADARGLEMGIFALFILFLAWMVSGLMAMGLQMLFENSGRARGLREAIERRAVFLPRFKRRRENLLQLIDQRNEGVNALQTQRVKLTKQLNKVKSAENQLVRQINENTVGTNCYQFLVANRYVLQHVSKGQQHPLLDESWKGGQVVEVWSKSLIDARIAVVDRYPATFGFFVEKLAVKGQEDEGDAPSGAKAGRQKAGA